MAKPESIVTTSNYADAATGKRVARGSVLSVPAEQARELYAMRVARPATDAEVAAAPAAGRYARRDMRART